MQVQQIPIYQFLEGSDKSFIIPVYQRDYAWTRINCQKLWEDIVDLSRHKEYNHFLGTVVTVGAGFQEYTVIDGQQRLTTISIIILALHNYLKSQSSRTEIENIIAEGLLDFLINKHTLDQERKIRLKPNKQDKLYFNALFGEESFPNVDSNIISNYEYFYKKIESNEVTPEEIYRAFQRLTIVLINLDRNNDDPQLIFESLNSTGVDLTAGDLIRNFMLMDLPSIEQENMYQKYWLKIENLTENVPEFARNYLIYKNRLSIKKDDVYPIFKKFVAGEFDNNKQEIAKDLLYYAKIYSFLRQVSSHPDKNINEQLKRLNAIEFTVCYPYLFDAFNDFQCGTIDIQTVCQILLIIESYVFRKLIVDNTTQGLNKMFITFSKEIKKEKEWKKEYLEILKYVILQKTSSQRFPADDEFQNALIYKEVYKFQSKNKNFLLESIENYASLYPINIKNFTIEHIMPQKLNQKWKEMLGENWNSIHKKYLHTLGNLSLTASNSRLSNNTLEKKQAIDYQESKLTLNFNLDRIEEWNEKEILERANRLSQIALDIWTYPITTFSKIEEEEQIFDLTSQDNFFGMKPIMLYLPDSKEISIKTWRNLFKYICKFLYEYSPTQFKYIEKLSDFQWYFDINKPLRSPIEFMPNKFVEGNVSANMVIGTCLKLCEEINYPPENISFSVTYSKKVKEDFD
jgi:uncharacterized protein with ParB-like and HNH nuclease domain